MTKSFDCITVGSSILDTFVMLDTVEHHPDLKAPGVSDQCFALGAKIDVSKIMQQSGGGSTNAAVTFTRQRLTCAVLSKVGDDIIGALILDELANDQVNTLYIVKQKGAKTGQSVILVDPNAERTILTDRGTSGSLTIKDLEALDDLKTRWLYVTSLNGNEQSLDYLFHWAGEHEAKVAWNPGMADLHVHSRLQKTWLRESSLFLVNREEAAEFVGFSGTVNELAAKIHQMGAPRAVVSDGSSQLAVVDGNELWTVEPHDIDAVDQTGAGDANGSGIVAGLLRGMTFRKSIDAGLLNAEHVIMHVGAKTGIMHRK